MKRGPHVGPLFFFKIKRNTVLNKKTILGLMLCLGIYGCGAGASGTKMTEYRTTIGSTTLRDFEELSEKILNRNRYFIDRKEEVGTGKFIDTKFVYKTRMDEEVLEGIREVRYRLTLEARVKGGGVGNMYTIRAIVNAYGKHVGREDWANIPVNSEIKKEVKMFISELKSEFDNKIRVF